LVKDLGLRGIQVDEGVAKVSIVGIGMRSHTGVASKMFQALYEAGINIEHISTSEIVVSCVVREQEGEKALKVLHEAFELDKASPGNNAQTP
jgi:aspartate kinase